MKYAACITLLFFCLSCEDAKEPSEPTRSFYMGFSPWLYDATLEAQDWVYNKLGTEGDVWIDVRNSGRLASPQAQR